MALDKRKILQAAQKHLQKGALDKALKEYKALLDEDPRDANVRLKVGDIHLRREDKEAALATYLKVAEQFMSDGFDAKAVAIYKQITKIDSKRYDIFVPLAELYQRLGLIAEAMNALQAASDGYQREGKKQESLNLVRRMGELDPTNTASRTKVAELLLNAGLEEEAVGEFEEIAKQLQSQGQVEEGFELFARVLEMDTKRPSTLEALARGHLEHGNDAKAEEFARRLIEADPERPEGLEVLAEVLSHLEREDEERDAYRRLAELYRARGEVEKARDILQRHVPGEPLQSEDDFIATETSASALEASSPLEGDDADEPLEEMETPAPDAALDTDDLTTTPHLGPAEEGASLELEGEELTPPLEVAEGDSGVDLEIDSGPLHGDEAGPVTEPLAAHADAGDTAESPPIGDLTAAELQLGTAHGEADATGTDLELDAGGSLELEIGDKSDPGELTPEDAELTLEAEEDLPDDLPADLSDVAAEEGESEAAQLTLETPADDGAEIGLGNAASGDLALEEDASDATLEDQEREFLESLEVEEERELQEVLQTPEAAAAAGLAGSGAAESGAPASEETPITEEVSIPGQTPLVGEDTAEQQLGGPEDQEGLEAPQPPAPYEDETPTGDTSTTQQIVDDLAEADFHFHQGLHEEAEEIYKRLLTIAPNHPQALLRLGEIAAARGEEPPGPDGGLEVTAPVLPGLEMKPHDSRKAADAASAPEDDFDDFADDSSFDDELGADLAAAAESDEPPAGDEAEVEASPHRVETSDETAEVEAPAEEEPAAPAEREDFDLAAELSDAFDDSDTSSAGDLGTEEEALRSIFSEFKKGVDHTLGEGDFEAHFDLGIAYREMGLFDDALQEFQQASQSTQRRLDCLQLMGLCALDLERASEAAQHLELALQTEGLSDEQRVPLHFDLGRAYQLAGDAMRARESWTAVVQIDPGFQDVEALLAALDGDDPDASSGEEAESGEEFESFDDLMAEVEEDLDGAEEDSEPPASGEADDSGTDHPKPGGRRRKKISFV